MACRPSQNRKRPEEESKRGAASQPNPMEERRGMTRDPLRSQGGIQEAESKKPPAAAKPCGAPKIATKGASTKPTASGASERTAISRYKSKELKQYPLY